MEVPPVDWSQVVDRVCRIVEAPNWDAALVMFMDAVHEHTGATSALVSTAVQTVRLDVGAAVEVSDRPAFPEGEGPLCHAGEVYLAKTTEFGQVALVGLDDPAGMPVLAALARGLETASVRNEQRVPSDPQERKLAALGAMAAGVAHDFNNLLSVILGRAHMLSLRLSDSHARHALSLIEQAAIDGARTIARIQGYARPEPVSKEIHVDALVTETVDRALHAVVEPKHDIETTYRLKSRARVIGNASELRQALTNIVNNAVDAMPDGGRLDVCSARRGEDVVVELTDSGVGMDAETSDRALRSFFSTKGEAGTGLGLSNARAVMEGHGGRLEVRSKAGRGTTVGLWLPALYDPAEAVIETPTSAHKVLIIDDDAAVLETLSEILKAASYEVRTARDGRSGIHQFGESDFDLVFTDLGMPGMNGWEVARSIKSLRPEVPVGVITGWGAQLDEREVRKRGVDLVVPKPFRVDEVLARVQEVFSGEAGA